MRIVFYGQNTVPFRPGFESLLVAGTDIVTVPDALTTQEHHDAIATADVIIASRFDARMPKPQRLRLFQIPAAGYDLVDTSALPDSATVCNCFGHDPAIAEFVMAALLRRTVPITEADQQLRRGDWTWTAGTPLRPTGELGDQTVGILGYGHIGKAVAVRAKAFGMTIHAANRSPITGVDRAFTLQELDAFYASVDSVIVTIPHLPETTGFVGAAAFAAMRPNAILINVARGPVVDEQALYDALHDNRIGGAVIDTWYRYPAPGSLQQTPANLPFHELTNIVMTPHMSGWTSGTIRRRQQAMADNINRCAKGEPCDNVIRPAK